MDKKKAVYRGIAIGAAVGFGGVVLGTFKVISLTPVLGAFAAGAAIVGGAVIGGNTAFKIAQKVNRKKLKNE